MDASLLVSHLEAENKRKTDWTSPTGFFRLTADRRALFMMLPSTVSGFNTKNHIAQMSGVILVDSISLGFT